MGNWTAAVLDLLCPPRCAFCERRGVHGVCPACEKTLPYAENPLREGAPFGRCVSPLRYEGAVRQSLLRFKFRGGQSAAEGYAQLMARVIAEEFPGEFDCITYVPVSEQRRRQRGYDQAQRIAVELGKLWDTPPQTLLRKIFDNRPQSGITSREERKGNVLGVYEAADTEHIQGARVLLVDDIITTGATLGECVRGLKAAGAQSVVCATVASAVYEEGRKATAEEQKGSKTAL
jgi:ComF family protein